MDKETLEIKVKDKKKFPDEEVTIWRGTEEECLAFATHWLSIIQNRDYLRHVGGYLSLSGECEVKWDEKAKKAYLFLNPPIKKEAPEKKNRETATVKRETAATVKWKGYYVSFVSVKAAEDFCKNHEKDSPEIVEKEKTA